MLHGKATNAIAAMSGKAIVRDPESGTASIESDDVKLIISEFNKLTGVLGISTHKLLSTAIAIFTANNNTEKGILKGMNNLRISISLKEYVLVAVI